MINIFLKLHTKYLLLIMYIVFPLFSFIISIILVYLKVDIQNSVQLNTENNLSITVTLTILVSVIIEELFFRYNQSDNNINKAFHLKLLLILIFLIFCRIFAFDKDLFVTFGFLVNLFFVISTFLKCINNDKPKILPIIPDKLFYVSNIAFALMHLVKFDFNFFTSDLKQLYFILPYLFYLFIFGLIMSIIRNRYSFGLPLTILLHFIFNLNFFLIELLLSMI